MFFGVSERRSREVYRHCIVVSSASRLCHHVDSTGKLRTVDVATSLRYDVWVWMQRARKTGAAGRGGKGGCSTLASVSCLLMNPYGTSPSKIDEK